MAHHDVAVPLVAKTAQLLSALFLHHNMHTIKHEWIYNIKTAILNNT